MTVECFCPVPDGEPSTVCRRCEGVVTERGMGRPESSTVRTNRPRRWTISHDSEADDDVPQAFRVTGPEIAWGSVEVMPVADLGGLRKFAEWVAGYESERQLVGSGVIEKAKKVLVDG